MPTQGCLWSRLLKSFCNVSSCHWQAWSSLGTAQAGSWDYALMSAPMMWCKTLLFARRWDSKLGCYDSLSDLCPVHVAQGLITSRIKQLSIPLGSAMKPHLLVSSYNKDCSVWHGSDCWVVPSVLHCSHQIWLLTAWVNNTYGLKPIVEPWWKQLSVVSCMQNIMFCWLLFFLLRLQAQP